MARDNVSKGLLVGFLTGAIVGAAVALLYAPKAGKELRQDIKNKADDLMTDAEKHLEVAKEKAISTINEGKKKAEQLVSDAKVKVEKLMKDADQMIANAKNKASHPAESQDSDIA